MGSLRHYVIRTDEGINLAEVQGFQSCSYTRVANNVGGFEVVARRDFDPRWLDVDNIVEFWRKPEGGEDVLEAVGLMRWWEWSEDEGGQEVIRFGGPDQLDLVARRIVYYYSGSAQSEKAQEADDMVKAVVRESCEALAGNDGYGRPRRFPAANFTVAADEARAPIVTRSFAWRRTLDVLQEIAEASTNLGTPLYFDVMPFGAAHFEFRTFINVLGMDRTASSGVAPMIFTKERGNLRNPVLREDWTEELNYVLGGGPGEDAARMLDPEKDWGRLYRSLWNRREGFQDAREESTLQGIANRAYQALQNSRPRLAFSGDLLDTPQARYGVDWRFGDKVTVEYHGIQFDGLVRAVTVAVDQDGNEQVSARQEVTLAFR